MVPPRRRLSAEHVVGAEGLLHQRGGGGLGGQVGDHGVGALAAEEGAEALAGRGVVAACDRWVLRSLGARHRLTGPDAPTADALAPFCQLVAQRSARSTGPPQFTCTASASCASSLCFRAARRRRILAFTRNAPFRWLT